MHGGPISRFFDNPEIHLGEHLGEHLCEHFGEHLGEHGGGAKIQICQNHGTLTKPPVFGLKSCAISY